MTIGELHYGRGTPMSLHELCVVWPAYFRQRADDLKYEAMQSN